MMAEFFWKLLFLFCAFGAITDALIAFNGFKRFGDMRLSWGIDGLVSAACFVWLAFNRKKFD